MSDECKNSISRSELEREIKHLRELLDASNSERDKALRLQGLEYERRLEVLNDAHARAERAVQLTVPRDMYDAFLNQDHLWKQGVTAELAAGKATSTANARFFTIMTALLALAFSALAIWLRTKGPTP